MLRKFLMPLGIAVLGSTTVAVLVLAKPTPMFSNPETAAAAVPVSVAVVRKEQLNIPVLAQGTVYPKRQINLVAQVAGQIVDTHAGFSDGGFFNPQQPLLQIDPRDYEVALLEADARLAEAENRLAQERGLAKQAEREWRELGSKQANDLFMRKPQLEAAKAKVAFAQADKQRAMLNLERTQISAPFTGRIKKLNANLGQFVTAGSIIAEVYDSSVFEVRVPLTELQASLINLPLANEVAPSPVTVTGVVAGVPVQWQGMLVRADAFVDPQTRMYQAVVEIDSRTSGGQSLIPGIFVQLEIQGKSLSNVIKLPRSALYHGGSLIAVDESGQAKTYQAKLLKKDQDYVWLQSPVLDGELVALEKQTILREGTLIEPIPLAIETLASAAPFR